jgi:hypothetical protein
MSTLAIELTLTQQTTLIAVSDEAARRTEFQHKTSPDWTAGMLVCLEDAAGRFGSTPADLLRKARSVTLSVPDLVSSTLEARSGSRIGLLVSQGCEQTLYGRNGRPNPALNTLVSKELIVGVAEETNERGEQVHPPQAEEVKEKIRRLLELGSGIIAISFKNSSLNPANEAAVKQMVWSDYPQHYLGAVPVLLASDFSVEPAAELRTNICLISAYTWFSLDQTLRRVESFLQKNGYKRSLLVTQMDGPPVPIHRVTPLNTCGAEQYAVLRGEFL